MTSPGFDDLFGSIFGGGKKPPVVAPTARTRQTARQLCAETSHRYQVHGKTNPTKVVCSRCEVSWAIGPRTEPSS